MNKYLRDLDTFPRDAAASWRHDGARGLLREMRLRTADRVLHVGRSLVVAVELSSAREVPPPPGVRIERYDGSDWSPFAAIATSRTLARFRRASARGRTCLAAWRGERVVGYVWLSTHVERDLESYDLPLPSDAIYAWDLFVASAERGNGIASALVAAHHAVGREQGHRAVWWLLDSDNRASQRAAWKSVGPGSRLVGELRFLTIAGRSWSRFRPLSGDASEQLRRPALVRGS